MNLLDLKNVDPKVLKNIYLMSDLVSAMKGREDKWDVEGALKLLEVATQGFYLILKKEHLKFVKVPYEVAQEDEELMKLRGEDYKGSIAIKEV